ncbi:MAG: type II toxin-antitoxin system prevent-host-death family antitoxin [Anaerolineales bacterium]|nr:type II toxin-antitoxin system prevent-host-death family antitoxin [Anaerolineales bacterium]
MLKSSEVQQNFGRVMDQALTEDEVVVARYGEPRVVILSYQRYQQLLRAEQAASVYFQPPDSSPETQKRGELIAQQVRQEVGSCLGDSLEEAMTDLRGRAWSS